MQSKIVLELKYKAPEGSRGGVGDRERGGHKEAGMQIIASYALVLISSQGGDFLINNMIAFHNS